MDAKARQARIEEYKRLCRKRGERCTVQRLQILEATLALDHHPTAEEIFEAVGRRMPGISRPTVYRVLEHLCRVGAISKACHPGHVARFDRRTDLHHHLVCLHCSHLIDIEDEGFDALRIPDTSEHGFEVTDYRVQLRGICRECLAAQQREETT